MAQAFRIAERRTKQSRTTYVMPITPIRHHPASETRAAHAHPGWTVEQAYTRAIQVMEYKVRETVSAGKWQ